MANDGGVVNDAVLRAVYHKVLHATGASTARKKFRYVTANPASFGSKNGVRVLEASPARFVFTRAFFSR